jgi:hypothetical protein
MQNAKPSALRNQIGFFERYTHLPLNRDNLRSVITTAIKSKFISLSSDPNPPSEPYISGDTFRKFADHVISSEKLIFDPSAVRRNNILFVDAGILPYFFRCIHPGIKNPYILITHNGDVNIDKPMTYNIDSKITHWFAQNVLVKHHKITPIPIGLENLRYFNHGQTRLFEQLRKKNVKKRAKIQMDFSQNTNLLMREPIYKLLHSHTLINRLDERLSAQQYMAQLAQHKFVLSPPGNGLDCHRSWEAMYVGTIPIVAESVTTASFRRLGLPLLIVSDWSEIKNFNKKKLNEVYESTYKNVNYEALWFSYWKKAIRAYQK